MDELKFDWDRSKATSNLKKHGVSFEEGATIFRDPDELMFADPDRSFDEERMISVGRASSGEVMLACYTERYGTIRMISVRWQLAPRLLLTFRERFKRMRDEYDLTNAVRGYHAERYAQGVTITIREDEETQSQVNDTETREEYDSSNATRKPYLQQFGELNLVSLDADVKAVFPDSKAVNAALWLLIETAEKVQASAKNKVELKKAS